MAAKPTILESELVHIDSLLVERLPELGYAVRKRVAQAVLEESHLAHLDPMFIMGIIEVESSFSGQAISPAGARGLMQIRPATLEYIARLEGVQLSIKEIWKDPAMQVRLGVRYLSRLEKQFKSLDLALMAYNAGPEKLKKALKQNDCERFLGYVRAVRQNYARFCKKLSPALAQVGPEVLETAEILVP
jgi:soluble lytic murein transglycosylase-like protein